jgi:GNAT superfamily N-acetyltransferase
MSTPVGDSAYALLTDGTTIEIRPARPGDFDAVREMYLKMSPDNLYLRFFSMGTAAAEREARRVCREPAPDRAALLAVLDGEVAGCGSYELLGADSVSAEVAMAVADDMHNRGVGTLLLEHLVSLAPCAAGSGWPQDQGPDVPAGGWPTGRAGMDLAARRRTMSRRQRTMVSGVPSSGSPCRRAFGITASRGRQECPACPVQLRAARLPPLRDGELVASGRRAPRGQTQPTPGSVQDQSHPFGVVTSVAELPTSTHSP